MKNSVNQLAARPNPAKKKKKKSRPKQHTISSSSNSRPFLAIEIENVKIQLFEKKVAVLAKKYFVAMFKLLSVISILLEINVLFQVHNM